MKKLETTIIERAESHLEFAVSFSQYTFADDAGKAKADLIMTPLLYKDDQLTEINSAISAGQAYCELAMYDSGLSPSAIQRLQRINDGFNELKGTLNRQAEIDEKEFDPEIVNLCKALNEFDGIHTHESCQGYIKDHRPGEPWSVCFKLDYPLSVEGYCALEFLVWVINNDLKRSGWKVKIGAFASAPYLNGPGESLYYYIEGMDRHPDELAKEIREFREEYFCLPED